MHAAMKGYTEIVQILLSHEDIDINLKSVLNTKKINTIQKELLMIFRLTNHL